MTQIRLARACVASLFGLLLLTPRAGAQSCPTADVFEPNNLTTEATPLGAGTYTGLTSHLGESDWYLIQLLPEYPLRVEITGLTHPLRTTLFFDSCGPDWLSCLNWAELDQAGEPLSLNDRVLRADTDLISQVLLHVGPYSSPQGVTCGNYDLQITYGDFFELPEAFCFGDGSGTPCPCANSVPLGETRGCRNARGVGAKLEVALENLSGGPVPSGENAPSVSNDRLVFSLNDAELGGFALLVSGDNRLPQTGCFGCGITAFDGLRCVGGSLRRLGTRAVNASGFAEWGGSWMPQPRIVAQGGYVAGQEAHFQAFYRVEDQLTCQTGLNTSNAIRLRFLP